MLAHGPSLQPRNRVRQQHISDAQRDRPKMKHMKQNIKEQGDIALTYFGQKVPQAYLGQSNFGQAYSVQSYVGQAYLGESF